MEIINSLQLKLKKVHFAYFRGFFTYLISTSGEMVICKGTSEVTIPFSSFSSFSPSFLSFFPSPPSLFPFSPSLLPSFFPSPPTLLLSFPPFFIPSFLLFPFLLFFSAFPLFRSYPLFPSLSPFIFPLPFSPLRHPSIFILLPPSPLALLYASSYSSSPSPFSFSFVCSSNVKDPFALLEIAKIDTKKKKLKFLNNRAQQYSKDRKNFQ